MSRNGVYPSAADSHTKTITRPVRKSEDMLALPQLSQHDSASRAHVVVLQRPLPQDVNRGKETPLARTQICSKAEITATDS